MCVMWRIDLWHDVFKCVALCILIRFLWKSQRECVDAGRDLTHSYLWYDAFVCDMTHSHAWCCLFLSACCGRVRSSVWMQVQTKHDPFKCVMWRIYEWHDAFTWVALFFLICWLWKSQRQCLDVCKDLTHSYVWCDACNSDMTHSHVRRYLSLSACYRRVRGGVWV